MLPPHPPSSNRRYALQSDVSKSTPWLTFMGWVSNGGDAFAPICCGGIDHLLQQRTQGSVLVLAARDTGSNNAVLRVIPFYHRWLQAKRKSRDTQLITKP